MSDYGGDDSDFDDDILIQAATQVEKRQLERDNDEATGPAKRQKTGGSDVFRKPLTGISITPVVGPSEDQIQRIDSDYRVNDFFCGEGIQQILEDETIEPVSYGATAVDPYGFDAASDDIPSDFDTPQMQGGTNSITQSSNNYWGRTGVRAPTTGLQQINLFGALVAGDNRPAAGKKLNYTTDRREEPKTHHELDLEAAKTWIYPTNLGKIRTYQYEIVQKGLFHNLLVALPTGLGKTFIAATVMLNWYRWTASAQIIFVAPTKPLVAQQIDACFNIVGIPYSQTAALTGEVSVPIREQEWLKKRVFFMTPQTLQGDLSRGIADPKRIVLLVVDEAHRAKGGYAYVEVVKFIRRFNPCFRVLALTATPGGDVQSVQEVIDGLDISRVEIRTDESLDIREYVHDRELEKEVFQYSPEQEQIMELYAKAVDPLRQEVKGMMPSWSGDAISLTPFGCTKALQTWNASPAGRNAHPGVKFKTMAIFSLLASVAHGMDLLKFHGINAAYHSWRDSRAKMEELGKNGKERTSKWKEKLFKSAAFEQMMDRLEVWTSDPEFIGHPKLAYLRSVILNHLLDANAARQRGLDGPATETRIMVFSSFRDSAEEIAKCLARTSPMIKPHVFVGQASSKNSKGMNQKKQLNVVERFKAGEFNVLVATSIGEEGLDIGQVDMIICYDSKASPLRMLQRMGRTGRKRAGKVVLLQMEGKEENDWLKAKDSYSQMQKEITNGNKFTFHEDRSMRILPREIKPVVDKRAIDIPIENTQHTPGELPTAQRKRKKATKKKFHMPNDVETGFITAAALTGAVSKNKTTKGPATGRKIVKEKLPPPFQDEAEPVPYLDSVFLSEEQDLEFITRYQTISGAQEDAIIEAPALDRQHIHQRRLTSTKYVDHSRLTRSYVGAMNTIATKADFLDMRFQRSLQMDDLDPEADMHHILISDPEEANDSENEAPLMTRKQDTARKKLSKTAIKTKATTKTTTTTKTKATKRNAALPIKSKPTTAPGRRAALYRVSSIMEADESSPPPSDPAYAFGRDIDLGSRDTPPGSNAAGLDYDSDLDSFIVGDEDEAEVISSDEERDEDSDDLELPSSLGISMLGRRNVPNTQVRRKTLAQLMDDSEQEEDAASDKENDDLGGIFDSSLPGLSQIMATARPKKDAATTNKVPIAPTRQTKRARKVISDDDDDDD